MKFIKKAAKTAGSNSDKTRSIVQSILSDIEANGEKEIYALAKKFDKWEGDFILSHEKKKRLIDKVPEDIKKDIRFAHEQIYGFAKAQKGSLKEFLPMPVPLS